MSKEVVFEKCKDILNSESDEKYENLFNYLDEVKDSELEETSLYIDILEEIKKILEYRDDETQGYEWFNAVGFLPVVFKHLLEKISENKDNFGYLEKFIEDNVIINNVIHAYEEHDYYDAEALAEYYNTICQAVLSAKNERSVEVVAKSLANWDLRMHEYYDEVRKDVEIGEDDDITNEELKSEFEERQKFNLSDVVEEDEYYDEDEFDYAFGLDIKKDC